MAVPVRTHYDVLGVSQSADDATIRAAYRSLARDHHPDRARSSSAVGGGHTMPSINEAYRVLNDPGRRALYDRSLGSSLAGGRGTRRGTTSSARAKSDDVVDEEVWDFGLPDLNRPARVPWRSLLLAGVVGVFGIVVLAQFSDGIDEARPDGILRTGDCVDIEANGDAREVVCTGESDLVVRAFVPFDGTCPGGTEPHRDRQGMGVACIQRPEDP